MKRIAGIWRRSDSDGSLVCFSQKAALIREMQEAPVANAKRSVVYCVQSREAGFAGGIVLDKTGIAQLVYTEATAGLRAFGAIPLVSKHQSIHEPIVEGLIIRLYIHQQWQIYPKLSSNKLSTNNAQICTYTVNSLACVLAGTQATGPRF